jgi:hypothetical protein
MSDLSELTPTTILTRSQDVASTPVDDELVMLDFRQSRYFSLDSIGHRVWDLLERPRSLGDLCSVLEREFDVEPDQCRTDVLRLLDQLREADLLEIRPAPA